MFICQGVQEDKGLNRNRKKEEVAAECRRRKQEEKRRGVEGWDELDNGMIRRKEDANGGIGGKEKEQAKICRRLEQEEED